MADIDGQEPTTPATEPTAASDEGQAPTWSKTDYEKEIARLRSENANRRNANKELKAKAERLDQMEADQLSEQEKLQKRLDEAEGRVKAAEMQARKAELKAMGVPESVLPVLNLDSLNFDDPEALKTTLASVITPPTKRAETPLPAGHSTEKAWDMERIKKSSAAEIMADMDAVRTSIGTGSTNKRL